MSQPGAVTDSKLSGSIPVWRTSLAAACPLGTPGAWRHTAALGLFISFPGLDPQGEAWTFAVVHLLSPNNPRLQCHTERTRPAGRRQKALERTGITKRSPAPPGNRTKRKCCFLIVLMNQFLNLCPRKSCLQFWCVSINVCNCNSKKAGTSDRLD